MVLAGGAPRPPDPDPRRRDRRRAAAARWSWPISKRSEAFAPRSTSSPATIRSTMASCASSPTGASRSGCTAFITTVRCFPHVPSSSVSCRRWPKPQSGSARMAFARRRRIGSSNGCRNCPPSTTARSRTRIRYEPQPGGCCSLWPYSIGRIVELPWTLAARPHPVHAPASTLGRSLVATRCRKSSSRFGLIQCLSHPDRGYLGDADKRAHLCRAARRTAENDRHSGVRSRERSPPGGADARRPALREARCRSARERCGSAPHPTTLVRATALVVCLVGNAPRRLRGWMPNYTTIERVPHSQQKGHGNQ